MEMMISFLTIRCCGKTKKAFVPKGQKLTTLLRYHPN